MLGDDRIKEFAGNNIMVEDTIKFELRQNANTTPTPVAQPQEVNEYTPGKSANAKPAVEKK